MFFRNRLRPIKFDMLIPHSNHQPIFRSLAVDHRLVETALLIQIDLTYLLTDTDTDTDKDCKPIAISLHYLQSHKDILMQISNRANAVKPSATVAINGKATQLKAQGVDIINLSVGEPDFDTPQSIKNAAIKAIEAGYTKYTAVDGIPELKEAIIQKFKNENYLTYTRDQILVSCGAKQSIYNLAQAVLNDGDEVIIPAPYWVSYPAIAALAGAKPVFVTANAANRFIITAEQLEKAITPKTRLLILN